MFMEMRDQDESFDPIPYENIKNCTREDIEDKAAIVISEAMDANIDALDLLITCNKWEKFTEIVKDGIKKLAYEQTNIADGEIYKKLSVDVERGVFGVKYNYKGTGDPIWLKLESDKKDRENYLRTLVLPSTISDEKKRAEYIEMITLPELVDEETGEVIQEKMQLLPPTKTGTAGLKITIKK